MSIQETPATIAIEYQEDGNRLHFTPLHALDSDGLKPVNVFMSSFVVSGNSYDSTLEDIQEFKQYVMKPAPYKIFHSQCLLFPVEDEDLFGVHWARQYSDLLGGDPDVRPPWSKPGDEDYDKYNEPIGPVELAAHIKKYIQKLDNTIVYKHYDIMPKAVMVARLDHATDVIKKWKLANDAKKSFMGMPYELPSAMFEACKHRAAIEIVVPGPSKHMFYVPHPKYIYYYKKISEKGFYSFKGYKV